MNKTTEGIIFLASTILLYIGCIFLLGFTFKGTGLFVIIVNTIIMCKVYPVN